MTLAPPTARTPALPAPRSAPAAATLWTQASQRPWLALYGQLVLRRQQGEQSEAPAVELAPIQAALPDEMILMIFDQLPPYQLGPVACVCRHWRALIEHPRLWEAASHEALHLQFPTKESLQRLVITQYNGSWKRVLQEHPHLRFDGIYVSRNTYVKTVYKAVHMVCYYRYFRFFPNGTLLYKTSPQILSKVAKSLFQPRPSNHAEHVYSGRYRLKGTKLYVVYVYPNSTSTEIRCKLALRSTHAGAFNRLDIESIVSYDHEIGVQSPLTQEGLDPESPDPAVAAAAREHRRGTSTCVLVQWEHVATSDLNLPASKMDFYF